MLDEQVKKEVTETYHKLKPIFADAGFYVTVVPTYVGGFMTLGWGTDDTSLRNVPREVIAERFAEAGFKTRYYTPAIHVGSFALPEFVAAEMRD